MITEIKYKSTNIVDRCIEWNAARYEQVFDYHLAEKLLLEELGELFEVKPHHSSNLINILDAVGDITFVAIGIMWKIGMPAAHIKSIFYQEDISKLSAEQAHAWVMGVQHWAFDHVNQEAQGGFPIINLVMYSTFVTALSALRGLGIQHRFYDVVYAICESNDTKEVKGKVAANVKANINKGAGFVPPENALITILKEEGLYHE